MPEKRSDVRIFNPHTGEYEPATAADAWKVKEHEAQAAGLPAPGDRTAEELRELEPALAGPVATGDIITPDQMPPANSAREKDK